MLELMGDVKFKGKNEVLKMIKRLFFFIRRFVQFYSPFLMKIVKLIAIINQISSLRRPISR